MATNENLKLRIQLIGKFDRLAAMLENGDESAIQEAHDHLAGLILTDDMETLALVMKAFASVLTGFQGQVDEEGWKYSLE